MAPAVVIDHKIIARPVPLKKFKVPTTNSKRVPLMQAAQDSKATATRVVRKGTRLTPVGDLFSVGVNGATEQSVTNQYSQCCHYSVIWTSRFESSRENRLQQGASLQPFWGVLPMYKKKRVRHGLFIPSVLFATRLICARGGHGPLALLPYPYQFRLVRLAY